MIKDVGGFGELDPQNSTANSTVTENVFFLWHPPLEVFGWQKNN